MILYKKKYIPDFSLLFSLYVLRLIVWCRKKKRTKIEEELISLILFKFFYFFYVVTVSTYFPYFLYLNIPEKPLSFLFLKYF